MGVDAGIRRGARRRHVWGWGRRRCWLVRRGFLAIDLNARELREVQAQLLLNLQVYLGGKVAFALKMGRINHGA